MTELTKPTKAMSLFSELYSKDVSTGKLLAVSKKNPARKLFGLGNLITGAGLSLAPFCVALPTGNKNLILSSFVPAVAYIFSGVARHLDEHESDHSGVDFEFSYHAVLQDKLPTKPVVKAFGAGLKAGVFRNNGFLQTVKSAMCVGELVLAAGAYTAGKTSELIADIRGKPQRTDKSNDEVVKDISQEFYALRLFGVAHREYLKAYEVIGDIKQTKGQSRKPVNRYLSFVYG